MRLKDILNEFDEFSLATLRDNDDLISFYHSQQMDTKGLQIYYDRGENFFDFLKVQGNQNFVIIYRNQSNKLSGIGTITVREQFVDGKKVRTLYLGDLRAKASKEVSKRWKELYSKIMLHLNDIEEFSSPYNFTVIMESNLKAINSLVKGQNKFEYVFLSQFRMTNVFSPGLVKYKSTYQVSEVADLYELEHFLNTQGVKYQLGMNFEVFKTRFDIYKGLSKDNVICIKDQGEVIGTCLLWQPSPLKKIVIKNLPLKLKLFNKVLSFITLAPKVGEELRVLYLNDLIIHSGYDQSQVVQSIMNYLKTNGFFYRYHSVAFANFETAPIRIKGFLKDDTKLLFYTVRAPGNENILTIKDRINFNLSWV